MLHATEQNKLIVVVILYLKGIALERDVDNSPAQNIIMSITADITSISMPIIGHLAPI